MAMLDRMMVKMELAAALERKKEENIQIHELISKF